MPSNIKRGVTGVSTTGAVDNIDESGCTELHGTAISPTNHLTHENTGISPPALRLDAPENATVHIPEDFAIVPYVDEYAGEITLSTMPDGSALPTFTTNPRAGVPDDSWLNHVHNVTTQKNGKLQEMPVTYSGFHSHGQQAEDIQPRATVGVFPIFEEKASTMATQKHAMLVVKKAIDLINPGQIPVIVGDCLLYTNRRNVNGYTLTRSVNQKWCPTWVSCTSK